MLAAPTAPEHRGRLEGKNQLQPAVAELEREELLALIRQEGFLPYSTTKAAVAGMTRCLAVDLAQDGIRVNGVAPGAVWSAAVQETAREAGWTREEAQVTLGGGQIQRRIADTREIGEVVAFVASDRASFMTGANVMVDGGWTAL